MKHIIIIHMYLYLLHSSTYVGGTVLSSYNRLIPNNAIIFDNGADEDTNVGDILPPDNSSSVAVIDCSTDNSQPLTWTDGAGQTVPTSPNLTVYQTTSGSSAALHIDTTDTSTFTNGRYQCDGGMARVVNIYINQGGGERDDIVCDNVYLYTLIVFSDIGMQCDTPFSSCAQRSGAEPCTIYMFATHFEDK